LSRPEKYTVDYFSHDSNASQGKTLTILYNHFGHEGISAWWQLLECISASRNQVIAISNSEDSEFLAAKMRFLPERLTQILDKLASLGAIDKELYASGYIWSDNFVTRISDVYKHRGQPLPSKKWVSVNNNPVSANNNSVSVIHNTQTKLNYSKEKESIKKKTSYTSEEIKSSEWYKSFLINYPAFNEKEFDHCLVWLEDHPRRKLNKSFLVNWAKKCSDKTIVNEQSLEEQVTKW